MLLRTVRRAALFEEIVWKLLGHIKPEEVYTGSISISVPVELVREAQALFNDPTNVGRYGKAQAAEGS